MFPKVNQALALREIFAQLPLNFNAGTQAEHRSGDEFSVRINSPYIRQHQPQNPMLRSTPQCQPVRQAQHTIIV
jgi:hypothetical protein